jgi:hypothetical protein
MISPGKKKNFSIFITEEENIISWFEMQFRILIKLTRRMEIKLLTFINHDVLLEFVGSVGM